mmetsp:Transcript_120115/g.335121  ORF Transcript_120115/g.335121 Transcript_120115/m.335121 type:complete len:228 (+) Transcript_120115:387-1070(+)
MGNSRRRSQRRPHPACPDPARGTPSPRPTPCSQPWGPFSSAWSCPRECSGSTARSQCRTPCRGCFAFWRDPWRGARRRATGPPVEIPCWRWTPEHLSWALLASASPQGAPRLASRGSTAPTWVPSSAAWSTMGRAASSSPSVVARRVPRHRWAPGCCRWTRCASAAPGKAHRYPRAPAVPCPPGPAASPPPPSPSSSCPATAPGAPGGPTGTPSAAGPVSGWLSPWN